MFSNFCYYLKGRSCLGALHGCLQSPGLQQVADLVQCFYQHHHDRRPHPHEHLQTAARHNKEPAPPARLPPPHPALRSSLQHHQVLREQGAKLSLECFSSIIVFVLVFVIVFVMSLSLSPSFLVLIVLDERSDFSVRAIISASESFLREERIHVCTNIFRYLAKLSKLLPKSFHFGNLL